MAWEIRSYLARSGENVVEEFIKELPTEDRALVRARIDFLGEVGNRLREPYSKSLGRGLFELRVKSRRVIYCFRPGGIIVLLHGFTKKTQKVPKRELDTAYKRFEELKDES